VFLIRHAGLRSGGIGAMSDDVCCRGCIEEGQEYRAATVAGVGCGGDGAAAREQGLALTDPHELLKCFTKNGLETAPDEETTEHLGHERYQADRDRDSANVRNGTRTITVVSDVAGEVAVPRARECAIESQVVKKRQRRTGDVDEIVLGRVGTGTGGHRKAGLFEWVLRDSSKNHGVTAPTSTPGPATTSTYTTLLSGRNC
jgi:hypothetical protein